MDHHEEEQDKEATEVDEQGKKFAPRDDDAAEGSEDKSGTDEDEGGTEVEEQYRMSDRNLKHAIASIDFATAALR